MANSKKTLLIMAGGLGSRYKGLKQVDGIVPSGEVLLEFSMYDAWRSGFNKFVVIVNHLIPISFLEKIQAVANKKAYEIHFVFQEKDSFLSENDKVKFAERHKPWGTAHAILCAKEVIQELFMVINADDFYGRRCYETFAKAIEQHEVLAAAYQMIAFPVHKTISDFGSVSRGICTINSKNELQEIVERTNISKDALGIYYIEDDTMHYIDEDTLVSMNCWLFHPSIFSYLESYFQKFLQTATSTSEFYIPWLVEQLIENQNVSVTVKTTYEQWLGMTYPQDKAFLQTQISKLVETGFYPKDL